MKKFDVTALGELLIDFTDNGKSAQGNTLFEANPGGAPCNVLAMLNKCGHPTAFVGKVGKRYIWPEAEGNAGGSGNQYFKPDCGRECTDNPGFRTDL